ncbi:MAG: outer membrane lipoprotein carrier protein LolA [Desulfovibrio sp.]|jgi:hypothetical protein|nr:outer membrane lipoprotein carrier protein LolA [Desulfovibrio sp.]
MKSNHSIPARAAALLLTALFVCCTPQKAFAQADEVLSALRRKAEQLNSVRADFVQETSIPMFAEPVRSHGRFAFKRPKSLRWEYHDPMREGFVLNGDTGFRWENNSAARKPFIPGSDPVATIVARQMIVWITFDMQRIGSEYSIEPVPGKDVRLKMTPLRDDVKGVITSIIITFSPAGPASLVEIKEAGGGGTSIRFSNTVVNGPMDGQEFQ